MSTCDPPDLQQRPSRNEPNWKEPVQAPIPSSRQDLSGNLWRDRRAWVRDRLFTFLAATELRDTAIATLQSLRRRKLPTESQERLTLHWGDLVSSLDGPSLIKELHGSSSNPDTQQKFNSIYHRLRTTFQTDERSAMETQLAALSRAMVFDGSGRGSSQSRWLKAIAEKRELLLLDSPKIEAESSPAAETRRPQRIPAAFGGSEVSPPAEGSQLVKKRKPLTPSEISLLRQLRHEGFNTTEIAGIMGMALGTVRHHAPVNKRRVTDDEIREAYSRLGNVNRVREELPVGINRICEVLDGATKGRRQRGSSLISEGEIFKMRALYRRGWGIIAISWQMHCHPEMVRKNVVGVVRIQPQRELNHEGVPMKRKVSAATTRAIRDEAAAGVPVDELAAKYKVSRICVEFCKPFDVSLDIVERADRRVAMRKMLRRGHTLEEVAAEWQVAPDYVRWQAVENHTEAMINDLWGGIYPEPDAELPEPTDAPPGSVSKMVEFVARLNGDYQLHHPLDAAMADYVGFDMLRIHGQR